MQQSNQADVVIVGAGPAGLLAAWRLAQQGVDVTVLESGPRVNRTEAVETYRKTIIKTPSSPYEDLEYASIPKVFALDDYYVQEGPVDFKSNFLRRVGGTTWHWLGTSLRLLPSDFEMQTRFGVGVDWPLSYDDLKPWYADAEAALGVAGDGDYDLGSPREEPYPLQPFQMTYLDRQLAVAAANLGYDIRVTPQARNSRAYDGRPPCCGNASCVPICPVGAKYDASFHAEKAEALGVRIITEAVAHRVDTGDDGMVTRIRYLRPDGSEEEITGQIFILAANAIETPRLLLMSRTDSLPNGVANSSDTLGRHLMDHPVQLSWALSEEPVYPYRSPLENTGIESVREGGFRSSRAAYRVAVGEDGWSYPGTAPVSLAGDLIGEGFRGQALKDEIERQVVRQIRFAALVEQLPHPDNRVSLAEDQTDGLGLPRPRIHYDLDTYTREGMTDAQNLHEQLFGAMNATRRNHSDTHSGAGHIMGTYRMGDDPATSVVDPEQRSHDHPNLFLLGSGVFPTAGTANPTLTIAALTLWAAETVATQLQNTIS